MSMFLKVEDFHRKLGLPIAYEPTTPDSAHQQLRISLLTEETNEFFEADAKDDIVEVADALADIAYILCGTAVAYGIVPDTFSLPVSLAQSHPRLPRPKLRAEMRAEMRIRFEAYVAAEIVGDLLLVRLAIVKLLSFVEDVAFNFGISMTAVFAEVHRSNMSKVCLDGTVLRRADGKVMKPPTFQPPNLRAVLYPGEDT